MIKVAISPRITETSDYIELRDSISHDWIRLLNHWEAWPIIIPNVLNDPEAFLDAQKCNILILTGADDYGQCPVRDNQEERLLAHAIITKLPVLAICRGMQMCAQLAGAKLENLSGHIATTHKILFHGPGRLVYPKATHVNSFHALGLRANQLPNKFTAIATDEKGYIEAMVDRENPITCIMWHPERSPAPVEDRLLFGKLVSHGAFWA